MLPMALAQSYSGCVAMSVLCTSGFVDEVMLSHVYPEAAIEYEKYNSQDSNQILLRQQLLIA